VRSAVARQPQARAGNVPRSWAIQVGAFNTRTDAARAANDGAKTVGQPARPRVDPGSAGRRQVFRARVVNLTQADAQAACTALARKRQPCMLIRPADAPEVAAAR